AVAVEGAILDYKRSVLDVDRATSTHPATTARPTVAAFHVKAFNISISQRQPARARDGCEGVSVTIPDGDRGGADGKQPHVPAASRPLQSCSVAFDRYRGKDDWRRRRPVRIVGITVEVPGRMSCAVKGKHSAAREHDRVTIAGTRDAISSDEMIRVGRVDCDAVPTEVV